MAPPSKTRKLGSGSRVGIVGGGPAGSLFSRTFWGIFTGSYSYRKIAATALGPGFVSKLAVGYLREKLAPQAAGSSTTRKILVLGGGFGGVYTTLHLELPGFPGVYALGDNAWVTDPATGRALPRRAHFAVRQPKTVASNILANLRGKPKKPYRWGQAIEMISLGSHNAAMSVHGIHPFGLPVRVLWVLGYLGLVTGVYNRIRIIMDWLLSLFFGRDSTLLRIERDDLAP